MRNGTPGIPCSPCLKKRTRPFTWRKIRGGTAPACTSRAPGNWKESDSPRAAAGFLFAAIARLSFYRHHRAFFLPSSRGLLFTVIARSPFYRHHRAFFLPSSPGFLFPVITGLSFCHHRAVSFLPSLHGLLFTVIASLEQAWRSIRRRQRLRYARTFNLSATDFAKSPREGSRAPIRRMVSPGLASSTIFAAHASRSSM